MSHSPERAGEEAAEKRGFSAKMHDLKDKLKGSHLHDAKVALIHKK